MKKYRSNEIYADFYENGNKPLVVLINGSKPGLPYPVNKQFLDSLKESYNVLLLAYFGVENLQKSLEEVPMEYFINAIDYIKNKINIDNDKIAIVGNSKGAEAALLLTRYYNSRITIATVPSCYTFQGLPKDYHDIVKNPKSSWTYNNKEVPYIKFYINNEIIKNAMNEKYIQCYEKSIELNFNNDSVINVDNYKGNILLISAEHDPYWPSKKMSNILAENCKTKGKIKHITLNLNGHYYLNYPESTEEILKFINKYLS